MDQFVENNVYQGSSQACVTDLTPPTFAGIATLVANLGGSLSATWLAAADASTPLRYEIYIKAGTATGLFSLSNITMITPNLSAKIYTLPDATILQESVTYYVGVRAVDAVGNRDANSVSLSAISSGVPDDDLASLINAVEALVGFAAQDIVGSVDDDDEILGSVDGDDDLIGTVEDC